MVGDTALRFAPHAAVLLRAVLATTLKHWRSALDLDLAAALDRGG